MKELTEARMMFEPIIAKLATERIRAEDFQKLDDNIEQALGVIQSNTPATSLNIEFHTLIARASYNPVIAITMENMFNVWKEWFLSQTDESGRNVEHSRNATLFHKEILKALHERDSESVYQLMLEHTLRINQQQSERQ